MCMTIYHKFHYETSAPLSMSDKVVKTVNISSLSAAKIIPLDSIPLNLTGFKLVHTITFLPTKSSTSYHFLIPDTICLISSPILSDS